ncbi:hypothetical protein A3759_07015 [Thalassolituus sp. HI0120]|nr:hypothetical protein A3759_07015 [Thalassolituus sp. HI0120]
MAFFLLMIVQDNKMMIYKYALVLVGSMSLIACGGSSSSSSGGNNTASSICSEIESSGTSCQQVIDNAVAYQDNQLNQFSTQLGKLQTDITAYCSGVAGTSAATLKQTAQSSWQQAMLTWQKLELLQFGKITTNDRNDFYSWPLSKGKTCNVDANIGLLANGASFNATPQSRGLTALEYLLFKDAPLASCTNNIPAASDVAERCGYAKEAVDSMVTQLQAVQSEADQSVQLQNVFTALFYIYTEAKGEKLQKTILPQHSNDSFKPDLLEYQFADLSRAAIEANLEATAMLFNGTGDQAKGFYDLLVAVGQETLANSMKTSLQTAINGAAASEYSQSWRDILAATTRNEAPRCINMTATTDAQSSDIDKICSLDEKIKVFTDDLNGGMSLALNLEIPSAAESDGD